MEEQDSGAILNSDGKNRGVDSRLFWEQKASEYTPPFEKKTLSRTSKIIRLMELKGVQVQGSQILDIGSGPGTFALPLAICGASVTALDISDNMLKRLAAEANRLDIAGVKTVRTSWKDVDPTAEALSGGFDIVLTALSLAIETEEDILRMERCSRQWCICIATGKIQRPAICNKIRRKLGLPLGPRPDIRNIRNKLEGMGRAFSYESFSTFAQEKKTIPQLAEDLAKSLEAQGKVPNRPQILTTISSMLKDLEQDGIIGYERKGDTGILMWRVDEN